MRRAAFPLLLCLGLSLSPALYGRESPRGARPVNPDSTPAWSYRGERGAAHWGTLSPAYAKCATGTRQSPIDLRPTRTGRLPKLRTRYRSGPLYLRNDGRMLRLSYPRGSYLQLGKRRFELRNIEFHTPAEHAINGRRADMEIQLTHVDGGGNRLNLAVTVVAGSRRNAMLQRIADYLPDAARSGELDYRYVGINPTFLLPSGHRYYRYQGSLTHPPCREQITWVVLREPLEVPAKLIERFHEITGDNNRPLQPSASRTVAASR